MLSSFQKKTLLFGALTATAMILFTLSLQRCPAPPQEVEAAAADFAQTSWGDDLRGVACQTSHGTKSYCTVFFKDDRTPVEIECLTQNGSGCRLTQKTSTQALSDIVSGITQGPCKCPDTPEAETP